MTGRICRNIQAMEIMRQDESNRGSFSIDFLSGCSTDQSDHDDAYGRRRENAHRNVESVRIQQEVYRSEVSWICVLATLTVGIFGVMIGEKILPYIINNSVQDHVPAFAGCRNPV